ncbi:MAG TPA: MmcQ/YjbR family DNA-binding protein [Gemmataceae bacterium]|nr:MmcQ/YjbR family DNA-binding protein [Gemmataceae bacterium]
MQALRRIALRFPEVEERIACKGTAIECTTFKARNKSFLFVGAAEARLKLRESIEEANKLASSEPARFRVGGQGWVKIVFDSDNPAPLDVLERWIDESYRLIAAKQLVAMLAERETPTGRSKTAKTKKPAKSSGEKKTRSR